MENLNFYLTCDEFRIKFSQLNMIYISAWMSQFFFIKLYSHYNYFFIHMSCYIFSFNFEELMQISCLKNKHKNGVLMIVSSLISSLSLTALFMLKLLQYCRKITRRASAFILLDLVIRNVVFKLNQYGRNHTTRQREHILYQIPEMV